MNYADYLQSDHWKTIRLDALKRAGNRCTLCKSSSGLEVHHNTYARLWQELDGDLVVLCRDCHKRHHIALVGGFVPNEIYTFEEVKLVVVDDEPEPQRTPRAVDEADFQDIKELWIKENRIVLDAQAGKITESQRAEAIADIRAQIARIRYE